VASSLQYFACPNARRLTLKGVTGHSRAQPLLLQDDAAWIALLVLAGSWLATEVALQLRVRRRGARTHADWTLYLGGGSIAVATALAVAFAWVRATRLGFGYWPVAVGLALYAVGVALRLWAVLTLGRVFTLGAGTQGGHYVVSDGPYRIVRHPSYAGLLIACLGLGVALANGLSVAALALIPLPAVLARIRVEERALVATLGAKYRSYARSRARLVPGIW
jgi:protein-S-isoprenylcysteine O-methyltransferase Ste14